MKKNIKFIIFAFLIICLIITIYILKNLKKEVNIKECNNLILEQIVSEINYATNNSFSNFGSKNDLAMYIPVSLFEGTNYIFSHGDDLTSDYFLIAENLSDEELSELKQYININNELYEDKEIQQGRFGNYTYIIFSNEYAPLIEGILRSYVYCK